MADDRLIIELKESPDAPPWMARTPAKLYPAPPPPNPYPLLPPPMGGDPPFSPRGRF